MQMTDQINTVESQEWSQDSDNQPLSTLVQPISNQIHSVNGNSMENHDNSQSALDQYNANPQSGISRKSGSKNEEKKIFVGGISWDTTDEDLKNFFGQFGEVAHVQIKFDHYTGRSRGFAFIEFQSADACQKSLNHTDYELKGKKMEVKPAKSRENKKIFVGGLPADFSEEDLRKHFEQFGKIEEIEWPFDKFQNKRKNFAFIVFEDETATQQASAENKQKFGDRMCDVKIAVPQYMRPQRQYPVPAYGTGWNEFAGYGAAAYGSYGGGYGAPATGGYYEDYYGAAAAANAGAYDYSAAAAAHNTSAAGTAPYDYSGWAAANANKPAGYDGWGYGIGNAVGATGTSPSTPATRGRGGYAGYGGY